MSKTSSYIVILLFLPVVLLSDIDDSTQAEINSQLEKFQTLLKYSIVYHKDSVNINKVSEEAFEQLMQSLDDKSHYFTADQYKELKESNTGEKYSLGITQVVLHDTSFVFQIDSGSSADSINLLPGYKILFINNEPISGKTEVEINQLLQDTVKKDVSIIFKDQNGDLKEKQLHFTKLISPSVNSAFKLSDTTAYIKMTKFSAHAPDEFKETLEKLNANGLNSLIIDLRGNPGGVLDAVIEIISNFVEKGKQVVRTEAKHEEYIYDKRAEEDGDYIGLPLILLVDENTASASELFAGAVQDYDMGLIVGKRTNGKGTLQKHWEFKDGSAFRVTVGEYVTPLGRKVQKVENESPLLSDELKLSMGEEKFNKIKESIGSMNIPKNVEVIESEKGRKLLSVGGILPDIKSENDTLTLLTQVLKKRRIIIETAIEILIGEKESLLENYPTMKDYCDKFFFNENIYVLLKNNMNEANIWNKEMFEHDKDKIINLIKARLGQLLYGEAAYYCVVLETDDGIKEAIKAVTEAVRLVKSE